MMSIGVVTSRFTAVSTPDNSNTSHACHQNHHIETVAIVGMLWDCVVFVGEENKRGDTTRTMPTTIGSVCLRVMSISDEI